MPLRIGHRGRALRYRLGNGLIDIVRIHVYPVAVHAHYIRIVHGACRGVVVAAAAVAAIAASRIGAAAVLPVCQDEGAECLITGGHELHAVLRVLSFHLDRVCVVDGVCRILSHKTFLTVQSCEMIQLELCIGIGACRIGQIYRCGLRALYPCVTIVVVHKVKVSCGVAPAFCIGLFVRHASYRIESADEHTLTVHIGALDGVDQQCDSGRIRRCSLRLAVGIEDCVRRDDRCRLCRILDLRGIGYDGTVGCLRVRRISQRTNHQLTVLCGYIVGGQTRIHCSCIGSCLCHDLDRILSKISCCDTMALCVYQVAIFNGGARHCRSCALAQHDGCVVHIANLIVFNSGLGILIPVNSLEDAVHICSQRNAVDDDVVDGLLVDGPVCLGVLDLQIRESAFCAVTLILVGTTGVNGGGVRRKRYSGKAAFLVLVGNVVVIEVVCPLSSEAHVPCRYSGYLVAVCIEPAVKGIVVAYYIGKS